MIRRAWEYKGSQIRVGRWPPWTHSTMRPAVRWHVGQNRVFPSMGRASETRGQCYAMLYYVMYTSTFQSKQCSVISILFAAKAQVHLQFINLSFRIYNFSMWSILRKSNITNLETNLKRSAAPTKYSSRFSSSVKILAGLELRRILWFLAFWVIWDESYLFYLKIPHRKPFRFY